MALIVSIPTSRRGYLSRAELAEYADITITDTTEADDRISQAEELIDSYVGTQRKFFFGKVTGKATAGSSDTLTMQSDHQRVYHTDFFAGMQLEIVGGTGKGQIVKISENTYAGVITVTENFSTTPDSTSVYVIYQLGKFPRIQDVFFNSRASDNKYYKQIPEAVRRAVAAQVAFAIEKGDAYFSGDLDLKSESLGDYSYTKDSGSHMDRLIAPKAKQLLRGITNRGGWIAR